MPLWNVEPQMQRTPDICWEATLRMMWHWRYKGDADKLGEYNRRLVNLVTVDRRLSDIQMDRLYLHFGLRSLANPQGKNVRHALGWSPVTVIVSDPQIGDHAVVISGSTADGRYVVVDPCGVHNRIECLAANETTRSAADIDGKLGFFIWYW